MIDSASELASDLAAGAEVDVAAGAEVVAVGLGRFSRSQPQQAERAEMMPGQPQRLSMLNIFRS
jgi:hypothetical protein